MRNCVLAHLSRNVVAYLALFIALGTGGALAATQINGAAIKLRSIPGNRLKPDGVTGKQVKERTLGRVPAAKRAATAQSAAIASGLADNTVNGAKVVDGSLSGQEIDESSLTGVGGLLVGRVETVPTGTSTFGAPSGVSDPGTQATVEMVEPAGGTSFVARNLKVSLNTPIFSGESYQVSLREGNADTALTCTVEGTVGGASQCTNTAASVSLSGGATFSIHIVSSAAAGSRSVNFGFAVRG